ncbi:hypothetical protein [Halochromatium glycolicum]|uniref:Uncharacterized protein n=1 Tax=Halochromatium glycolicum TaxID=85075 RepID=A0AAJ0XAI5_9GAMM|nr:hypothetical protein [Halochromatium glycolicum]MBK1704872.1 hypothetical protein [Halochromatium glycolicum]
MIRANCRREAGDPRLFDRKGRVIVGEQGCSRYFILVKLETDQPRVLGAQLEALRQELLADPYFKGVPSMTPENRKMAFAFHAKEDVPEVRSILEQLEQMPEDLLALSDDIWLSIDHNDSQTLEEGVAFKKQYNAKVAAFPSRNRQN